MFCLCIGFAPNFDRLAPKPPLRARAGAAPAPRRTGAAKSARCGAGHKPGCWLFGSLSGR